MSTQAPKDQVFHMEGDVTTKVKKYEWEKLKEIRTIAGGYTGERKGVPRGEGIG